MDTMWLTPHLTVFQSSLINTFVVSFLNMYDVYVGFRGCLNFYENTGIGFYLFTIFFNHQRYLAMCKNCWRFVFFSRLVIIARILVVK